MKNFLYTRAEDGRRALAIFGQSPLHTRFIAGGTNLVDLMRENIETPDRLIDVSALETEITVRVDGSIRIGAGVKNTALAAHPVVRERFPLLSEAVLLGASGQIRNMASVGGNIMQRTRCAYFYDSTASCNKRHPGHGCDAIDGDSRYMAILGASDKCIATHPSDMCVALAALDARVDIEGKGSIPFLDVHRLPGDHPERDTNLEPGDLISAIEVAPPLGRSTYRKVRDRSSYAFALVSVAASLKVEDGIVRDVRVALGGVAHMPWRARIVEDLLLNAPATEESFLSAAHEELQAAIPRRGNAFKIDLAQRLIALVLKELAQ
jgi:xanthine dehydrogenase YagS FAD-binding subunit